MNDKAPMEVRGEMPFFDNGSVSRALTRLLLGPWRFAWCVVLGAAAAGAAVLGELTAGGGPALPSWGLPAAFGAYAVLVLAAFWGTGRMMRAVSRRRWTARGAPSRIHVLWRLGDEGFRMEHETKTVIVPWPYVSQLSLENRHWLVVGAGLGYFLSRRIFTSPAEERAFIAALLDRLQPLAQARSLKARTWLAAQHGDPIQGQ